MEKQTSGDPIAVSFSANRMRLISKGNYKPDKLLYA
jgi:hypothetical protein